MKKILSILMISILLLVSIPFASAEVNIQIGEPFTLHYGEREVVLHDADLNNGDALKLEIDLVDIFPGRVIRQGNFELRFPSSTVITWRLIRFAGMFEWWNRDHIVINQHEGNIINIDDRYNLHILNVQGGEWDSENVVTLRLDRNINPL